MTSDSFWCSMLHTHFVGDKDVLRFNTWVLTAVLTVVVVVVVIVVQFLVSYLSVCPVAQLLSSSVLIRHHPATACNTTNFSREDGEYLYCSVKPHICKKKSLIFRTEAKETSFLPEVHAVITPAGFSPSLKAVGVTKLTDTFNWRKKNKGKTPKLQFHGFFLTAVMCCDELQCETYFSSSTSRIFPWVTSREVTFCSQTQTLRADSKHTHRCEHTA